MRALGEQAMVMSAQLATEVRGEPVPGMQVEPAMRVWVDPAMVMTTATPGRADT